MNYNETQQAATAFLEKAERYALQTGQGLMFRQARNVITDVLNRSYSNVALREKFYGWLKTPSTIALKEFVASDDLKDFQVFDFIDTVSVQQC